MPTIDIQCTEIKWHILRTGTNMVLFLVIVTRDLGPVA